MKIFRKIFLIVFKNKIVMSHNKNLTKLLFEIEFLKYFIILVINIEYTELDKRRFN